MSRYHDDTTAASHPGGLSLSLRKLNLFRYRPTQVGMGKLDAQFPMLMLQEHLQRGDSRAAVVLVADKELIIGAYTDELDCAVLLKFPRSLIRDYSLQVGSRLLTVNTYQRGDSLAEDLLHGPRSYHRYSNCYPFIAEFLSDDMQAIQERKSQIAEAEWARVLESGTQQLAAGSDAVRNGSPYESWIPGERKSGTSARDRRSPAGLPADIEAAVPRSPHPRFGAHLLHCPRRRWPLPFACFVGGFVALLSLVFFVALLMGDDYRTMVPATIGASCGLPLGLFLLIQGYREQPMFDFYADGVVVSGGEHATCAYSEFTCVDVSQINFYLESLVPAGSLHRLRLSGVMGDPDAKAISCDSFQLSRVFPEFEELADWILARCSPDPDVRDWGS